MMSSALLGRIVASSRRASFTVARRELSMLQPLDVEFPDLPSLTPTPAKVTSPSVTTLANGLTIVTEDACTLSSVTMTYPKAGSSNETIDEHGAALVNKHLNFRSASGMTTLLINRMIEDDGGCPFTTVDRKGAVLGFTVAPELAIGLIPLLATSCSFEKWDIRDALQLAENESELANESAQVVLTESLFAAAYGAQSPAGRPLYYPTPDKDAIVSFRTKAYGLNGAILAVTGVKDHSAFVTEAASLLAESPSENVAPAAPITYIGGESRVAAPKAKFAHIALAFPAPSSSVLSKVVERTLSIIGSESGVSAFSSTGILGVYLASDSPSSIVDKMIEVLTKPTTSDVVARAKKLAKADALLALDGGSLSLANAMTASVLESGTFVLADITKSYDSITEAQVKAALSTMLNSKPSLAAIGNISSVPYLSTIGKLS